MKLINRIWAGAKHWAQYTSVQLAVLAGAAGSYAAAYPDEARQVVELVPEQYRPLATFAVVTVLPIWARVRTQPGIARGDGA